MLVIPIQPVPSQQVLCVLENQNCQIAVYIRSANGFTNVYVDLNSNGVDMCVACLAHNGVPLDSCNAYDGFQGNLYFIDTQGEADPQYTGFGTRWFLVYLTPEEVLLTAPTFENITELVSVMTLSATLEVTAPNAGNFAVAHGLEVVPFLIEIIPTSAGAIWAQISFADETNVYLVASDIGVTGTVLVFTAAAANLVFETPGATLLVDSSGPGDFSEAHGLGVEPAMIEILPTAAGEIGGQPTLFDSTDVYLTASAAGITATVSVYRPPTGALNLEAPAASLSVTSTGPGAFSVPHNLSAAPSRIQILMLSGGSIWAATPAFDGSNVYLEASDTGLVAKVFVYA